MINIEDSVEVVEEAVHQVVIEVEVAGDLDLVLGEPGTERVVTFVQIQSITRMAFHQN